MTTPNDIAVAKRYLGIEGYTYARWIWLRYIHQLKVGRPCILGGVHIESELGPDGHSDADVPHSRIDGCYVRVRRFARY